MSDHDDHENNLVEIAAALDHVRQMNEETLQVMTALQEEPDQERPVPE